MGLNLKSYSSEHLLTTLNPIHCRPMRSVTNWILFVALLIFLALWCFVPIGSFQCTPLEGLFYWPYSWYDLSVICQSDRKWIEQLCHGVNTTRLRVEHPWAGKNLTAFNYVLLTLPLMVFRIALTFVKRRILLSNSLTLFTQTDWHKLPIQLCSGHAQQTAKPSGGKVLILPTASLCPYAVHQH